MIYLLRHGDAEDGEGMPDAERRLTEKGKRQSAAAGRALARWGSAIEACLTSPKVRAEQTARLACRAARDVEVESSRRCAAGLSTRRRWLPAAASRCWSATSRTSRTRWRA